VGVGDHSPGELSANDVIGLSDVAYKWDDQGAVISSGSFQTDGMVVVPCNMKTLAGIRMGYAEGYGQQFAGAGDVDLAAGAGE
jgi:flavin prenyltransferase